MTIPDHATGGVPSVARAALLPSTCPRCHGEILWLDGVPSPDVVRHPKGGVVGCSRCVATTRPAPAIRRDVQPAPGAAASSLLGDRAAYPPDPRTAREKVFQDGAKVVGLVSDGLDVLERTAGAAKGIRDLWNKITGK